MSTEDDGMSAKMEVNFPLGQCQEEVETRDWRTMWGGGAGGGELAITGLFSTSVEKNCENKSRKSLRNIHIY